MCRCADNTLSAQDGRILTVNPDLGPGEADRILDDALRLVHAQVPELVAERVVEGETAFRLHIEGSLEAVDVDCQAGGQPVFIVSDEYSWIQANDATTTARAILDLLKA